MAHLGIWNHTLCLPRLPWLSGSSPDVPVLGNHFPFIKRGEGLNRVTVSMSPAMQINKSGAF